MMKPLPQFWKAFDALPGAATDRRDWAARLGAEFPLAQRFLRATGRRATAIDCPSPGDDGCPRAVIKSAGGALRAVCRSATGRCDPLDLQAEDTDILQVDFLRLRQALAAALEVQAAAVPSRSSRVVRLGEHAIAAGVAAPVILLVPGPMDDIQLDELRDGGLGGEPAVLLVPTAGSLPSPMRVRLASLGHLVLNLSDVTGADGRGNLLLVQPVELLLHDIRAGLQARIDAAQAGPSVSMPAGAQWAEVTFVLISDEVLNVTCRGQTQRLEPDRVGMKDGRTGKPTEAWAFLQVLARAGGVLGPLGRDIVEEQKKKKQALSRQLVRAFGISDDPLRWSKRDRAYQTAFLIRDERPKTVRMAAGRR
ncbi:hypothetical protein [Roseicella aquatilis]|uniref:Uncharacterized protein n=1 Tax=Roseicella aquatilis TaxID=2527868 RepID=A0A4V2WLQ1_9PROT|nr:hypothetical protein [Roseicella aquatilis]TCZ63977.1 hypothetical protein EXY23_08340 [Roseicella aquatilis]